MSMIEQQLKEIRDMAGVLYDEKRYAAQEVMCQAADTIEALSAKLAVANMERSDRYYGGGWIACEDRLPVNYQDVLVSGEEVVKQAQFINNVFECEDPDFYAMLDDEKMIGCEDTTFKALAWQPLPEHYRP